MNNEFNKILKDVPKETKELIKKEGDILELVDKALIGFHKELKTKVNESRALIRAHEAGEEKRIFDLFKHTKRGRFLCWLIGFKTFREREQDRRKRLMKVRKKIKKLGE